MSDLLEQFSSLQSHFDSILNTEITKRLDTLQEKDYSIQE